MADKIISRKELVFAAIKSCKDVDELREYNHFCCKKIKILDQLMALDFNVDDTVSWESHEGDIKTGKIIKMLAKKAKVYLAGGVIWTVHVGLLKKS